MPYYCERQSLLGTIPKIDMFLIGWPLHWGQR